MDIFDESFNAQMELVKALEGCKDRGSVKQLKRGMSKLILYVEQDGKCCFCGIKMFCHFSYGKPNKSNIATIEHIECRSMGGPDTIQNYALSCASCNSARGITNFELFKHFVKSPEDRNKFVKHKRRENDRIRSIRVKENLIKQQELMKKAAARKERNRKYAAECEARHQAKLARKMKNAI